MLLALTIAFSLLALPNYGGSPSLPGIHSVRAATAPNVPWIPAGPSTDTLTYPIFTDGPTELTALQSPTPPIDFTDWPIPNCGPLCTSSNFQVTAPISDAGYSELEFHMGQNFWGCQFNFGNAACGTNIRQAFAHGLDKNTFVSTELPGIGVAVDNPVPPSVTLNSPDPCAWDSAHAQTGSGCTVNGAAGTAYHLAAAAAGSGCANTPSFAYTPGCGTPDFCAAADHLIAAGLATGKNPTTCVLTGISSAVAANSISFFIRSDDTARLHAGESYEQFLCALFTGTFTAGCTGVIVQTLGPVQAFPGLVTGCVGQPACSTSINLNWWVYTAGFGNVLTFDSSLFYRYDSQFVNGLAGIVSPSGPCNAKAVPSNVARDYIYLCSSSYDSNIEQAEFASCLTAPGDPATGQTHLTVTFANCPFTSQLSSASAAYKAQDIFGQNAFTIPGWTLQKQFAYLTGWQGAVVNKSDGFTPPGNFFTMLNAWNPSPPVPGTVRQGLSQGTGSVSPFIGPTPWDLGVIGSIWDTPGTLNPDLQNRYGVNQAQPYLDWMTIKTDQIPVGSLSYAAPAGTVAAFRYTLRNDIFWHTGQKLTAWDLAFSYIALKS